jgi:hypothetical protein
MGAALGSLGIYMIMLFIVDLVIIIQKKYKQEKRTHNIKIYGKKLAVYKEVIETKMMILKDSHNGGGDMHGHDNKDHTVEKPADTVAAKKVDDKKVQSKEVLRAGYTEIQHCEADLLIANNLILHLDPNHVH